MFGPMNGGLTVCDADWGNRAQNSSMDCVVGCVVCSLSCEQVVWCTANLVWDYYAVNHNQTLTSWPQEVNSGHEMPMEHLVSLDQNRLQLATNVNYNAKNYVWSRGWNITIMSLQNLPTFVGLVEYTQTFLSLHIFRLHDFKLSDGRRQKLCLLQ